MAKVQSNYVMVNGIRTHYLEAGQGDPVMLLHSGEFGGCAELSWEYNIEELSEHFHVYAPDWLGFGKTEKIFDFNGMYDRRIEHIRAFMNVLCIESAHFIGNSMGASVLIKEASQENPRWNMNKIIVVSGGGFVPENEARRILNTYDCTREHMRKLLDAVFIDKKWLNDAYVEKRYQISLEPGAWECTAAARFKSPTAKPSSEFKQFQNTDYTKVKVPTFIMVGELDTLREPGYHKVMEEQIPNNRVHIFKGAGHCPNIECHEEFNPLVIEFLK